MKKPELFQTLKAYGLPVTEEMTKPELQSMYDKAKEDGVFEKNIAPDPRPPQLADELPEADADLDDGIKPEVISSPVKAHHDANVVVPESAADYMVLTPLQHDGVAYKPGKLVHLSPKAAAPLLRNKVVMVVEK